MQEISLFSEVARRQLYGDAHVAEVLPVDPETSFIDDRFLVRASEPGCGSDFLRN